MAEFVQAMSGWRPAGVAVAEHHETVEGEKESDRAGTEHPAVSFQKKLVDSRPSVTPSQARPK